MRFEIRKSGGPACPTCGATELVHTKQGEAITADFVSLLEDEFNIRRDELLRQIEENYEKRILAQRETLVAAQAAAHAALKQADKVFDNYVTAVVDGTRDLVNADVSRWRPFERRRQARLAEQVEALVAATCALTARV